MDIDLSWFLIGVPLAFVLGWLASRFDLRQLRIDNRRSPKAYFKGLNHLLNERQDEAIDAFVEAVQKDPDTSELHFALGNLFRKRGEYDRAVRVHQHLLARGDLNQAERERAQNALAQDYLKAGLLDRAEEALAQLEGSSFEAAARLARLGIYERTRDWKQASLVVEQLQASPKAVLLGDFSARKAHFLCEMAGKAPPEEAEKLLEDSLRLFQRNGRAQIALAGLAEASGDKNLALNTLFSLAEYAQAAIPLVADKIVSLSKELGKTKEAFEFLEAAYKSTSSLDVLQALCQLPEVDAPALQRAHLQNNPSLVVAAAHLKTKGIEPEIQKALDKATQPLQRYRCAACGFEASRHFWQCPGCQNWDTYSTRRAEEI